MRKPRQRTAAAIGVLSVAACGGQSASIPSSAARAPQSAALRPVSPIAGARPAQAQYSVLYNFPGSPNGNSPVAGLANVNGVLYGTTFYGGAGDRGAVFKIKPSGVESVIYSFEPRVASSLMPEAAMINVDGVLYGTTYQGGAPYGKGTVFKITTSGSEIVLHNFGSGSDGQRPMRALTEVNGVLYGTTSSGGQYGWGTVYKITTSGAESVIYNFKGGSSDGANPESRLLNVNGVLYGTTMQGGPGGMLGDGGAGTVFTITPSGAESVLYTFKGGSDGQYPQAGLIDVNGVLYGTTDWGGYGVGTVFSITTSGVENVLYRFQGGGDGANPQSSLTDVNGLLYGTTIDGGVGGYGDGNGTVFSVTTSGVENVIYAFKDGGDGYWPESALTDINGVLYGTTSYGGTACPGVIGCGTVFAVKP